MSNYSGITRTIPGGSHRPYEIVLWRWHLQTVHPTEHKGDSEGTMALIKASDPVNMLRDLELDDD